MVREVSQLWLSRPQKLCNFLEWREYKLIYKRYASLFFITCGAASPLNPELQTPNPKEPRS